MGDNPLSSPNEDEKLLLRFDWNINDDHNAVLTYTTQATWPVTSRNQTIDDNEYEFSNHYYEDGAELNAYSGQLRCSDWTDNFSTELRIGRFDVGQPAATR